MNSKLTLLSERPASDTTYGRGLHFYRAAIVILVAVMAAAAANAQISSINSAVLVPRVFNDVPAATLRDSNNYPATISISESNVVAAGNKFANRDVWYYSANGTTPYLFHSNDYFYATFSVTLTGGLSGLDLESGILFSDPSGVWGGDLQAIVTAS